MPVVTDKSVQGIIDVLGPMESGSSSPGSITSFYSLSHNGSSGNRHTYTVSIPSNALFTPIMQAAKLNTAFPSANFKIVLGSGESIGMACYTSLSTAQSDSDGASGVNLSVNSSGSYSYSSTIVAVNFYSSNSRDYELFNSASNGNTIPIRLVKTL